MDEFPQSMNRELPPNYDPLKIPLMLLLTFGSASFVAQIIDGGYGHMYLGLWAAISGILVSIIGIVGPKGEDM